MVTAPDEFLAPIREKLAAWDGPLCVPSGLSMGWPGTVGGCHFCDTRVTEGMDWMDALSRPMIVCAECGNKRCPKASWHRNACTGSNEPGQDHPYPEPVTRPESARLLAALDGVLALANERATTLRETSDRLSQQVIDRHPDRDSAAALRYAAYAQEAEAFAAKIRNTVTTALEGQG